MPVITFLVMQQTLSAVSKQLFEAMLFSPSSPDESGNTPAVYHKGGTHAEEENIAQ